MEISHSFSTRRRFLLQVLRPEPPPSLPRRFMSIPTITQVCERAQRLPCSPVLLPRLIKVLEDENGRLKRLLADAMLDNAVLKEVASKNW